MSEVPPIERWPGDGGYTLDLMYLSNDERVSSADILGDDPYFVTVADDFEISAVKSLLFEWGDPRAPMVLGVMSEFTNKPSSKMFNLSTVIGNRLWRLDILEPDFKPERAFKLPGQYIQMPYDLDEAPKWQREQDQNDRRKPEIVGRVGAFWVSFKKGVAFDREGFDA